MQWYHCLPEAPHSLPGAGPAEGAADIDGIGRECMQGPSICQRDMLCYTWRAAHLLERCLVSLWSCSSSGICQLRSQKHGQVGGLRIVRLIQQLGQLQGLQQTWHSLPWLRLKRMHEISQGKQGCTCRHAEAWATRAKQDSPGKGSPAFSRTTQQQLSKLPAELKQAYLSLLLGRLQLCEQILQHVGINSPLDASRSRDCRCWKCASSCLVRCCAADRRRNLLR